MSYYNRYAGDPRWLTTRYAGECAQCKAVVPKDARAFYYPKGKRLLCAACGESASAAFSAAAWDEENNRSL